MRVSTALGRRSLMRPAPVGIAAAARRRGRGVILWPTRHRAPCAACMWMMVSAPWERDGQHRRLRGVLCRRGRAAAGPAPAGHRRPPRGRRGGPGGLCPRLGPLDAAAGLRRARGLGAPGRPQPGHRSRPGPAAPGTGAVASRPTAAGPGRLGRGSGAAGDAADPADAPAPGDRAPPPGRPVHRGGRGHPRDPPGAVKSLLARGRRALANQLGDAEEVLNSP